jgi:hypothetical protein
MSKITPDIINTASLGNGFKKKLNDCPNGFVQSESGCIQNCPSNKYLNNICRCNSTKDCPYGFTCLNNLCLSTDEKCPDYYIKNDNKCIQKCIKPENQNGPLCKCESSDDCNLGQECDNILKHCIIKPESLDFPLGISSDYEKNKLKRQEIKNKHTYNYWLLLPIAIIILFYVILNNINLPLKGIIFELLLISSLLFINYNRLDKTCNIDYDKAKEEVNKEETINEERKINEEGIKKDRKIPIIGTIRKSVIILGLSTLLVRLFTILPPLKTLISNIGRPIIGVITSVFLLILFLINNHLDDKLEGEDYDCNYILNVNTIKDDIKEPSNIVFLISIFMICVRIFNAFK